MKRFEIHNEALAELDEAIEWYNQRRDGLGVELHDEVSAAIAKVVADPGIGARHGNSSYRFYRVMRFPYLVYYRDLPDMIWVAAIAHGRRRPNYWRRRKPP